MLRISEKEPISYEYEENGYYYNVKLRTNIITLSENEFSYNEYSCVITKRDDIDNYIKTNFDILLENAKVNEENKKLKAEITSLKKELDDTDYQVLKCTENYMLGSAMPYDFSKLLYDRQKIRDDVDSLEDSESITSDELTKEKKRKIKEMSAASQTAIISGIDYNEKHYRLNTMDQINLMSLYSLAAAGHSVPYHADGELCSVYSAEDMVGLVQAATKWIIYHNTYFNLLKHQINDMTDINEISKVEYGITLNDSYQKILSSITGE